MSKIFEYLGIIIFLWSRDHLPMHFHARYQEYEMSVEISYKSGKPVIKYKKVKGRKPFPPAKLADLKKFVKAKYMYMTRKWQIQNIYKMPVKCEKITKLKTK